MRVICLPSTDVGHSAPITHVDLRADGRMLASSSYDGSVIIWDITDPADPRPIGELRHRRLVNGSAWNPVRPDLIATASADKTVVVWDVGRPDAPTVLTVLSRHTDDVNAVAWMPDGQGLVCVSEDGRATLWDGVRGRFVAAVSSHTAHCMAVSVSRTGLIATVGEDGLVAVRSAEGDGLARRGYDCSIEGCAWSRSGGYLAVARDDGRVDVLSPSLEVVCSLPVSSSAARSIGWSDDDGTLVVGAYDGAVHVVSGWAQRRTSSAGAPAVASWRSARAWPRSVAVAGTTVAVGSFGSVPHLLDLQTRAELTAGRNRATHGPNALTAHNGQLFVGCDSGTILALGLQDAGAPATWRCTSWQATDSPILSLAADDEAVYAGTYRGTVLRLAGESVRESGNLGAPVPSLVRRGDALLAGTYNGEVVALRPAEVSGAMPVRRHGGSVKSLARIDEDRFASAATDRTVMAGDRTGATVLWEHGNLVNAVAALGSRVVASASRDRTVRVGLLDPGGSGVIDQRVLMGADESMKAVGLLGTPDETVVLGGSYDFGLYAWRVRWSGRPEGPRAGELVAEFGQAVSTICAIDSRTAAVAAWDGQIAIVGLDPGGGPAVVARVTVTELVERAGLVGAGQR